MARIEVVHDFSADPATVFARVSDHARFIAGRGLVCRVVVAGVPDANGLGAVREVRSGALRFRETVTAFDAPGGYSYRIDSLHYGPVRLPFVHRGGRIELAAVAGGTRATWVSEFTLRLPLIGEWLAGRMARQVRAGFVALLRRVDHP
jgi:hypothetical protein